MIPTLRKRLLATLRLAIVLAVPGALATGPATVSGQSSRLGQWEPKFDLPNVAIHVHVLPTGKVLFWSRREWTIINGKAVAPVDGLDPHHCTPRIWDPATGIVTETPKLDSINLFCSGHTFLPDGRLFVVGGHIADSQGDDRATIYDPFNNTWSTNPQLTSGGRWYPTAITLPDGSVLVSFGSIQVTQLNDTQQIWKGGLFQTIVNFTNPPLYPRMHVVPDGRVFMSGPNTLTQFLTTSGATGWSFLKPGDFNGSLRSNMIQDYAPSVMYADGKILYVGGGIPPSNAAQVLDLNQSNPTWRATKFSMSIGRRHHNATILPDGTVLVTGGTSGSGGPEGGFNDLSKPVKTAELWDPATEEWTVLAAEDTPRCYHGTAVLLPDARVFSAGGGEYNPTGKPGDENNPEDSHRDAQIFQPPYLFRGGTRPVITSAPAQVTYNQTFTVGTSQPQNVGQVNWVRLSSVTHAFNRDQRINFLKFTATAMDLSVTAPNDPNICPPGHYMLFVLDASKVPSVAKIIRIQ
jgi:galactose oxidase